MPVVLRFWGHRPMSWLTLEGDDVCLGLEREQGRLMLIFRHRDGDCPFPCSAANLQSIIRSGARYHLAGEGGELTLQKIGGHIMLSVKRGHSSSVHRVGVSEFEGALDQLLRAGETENEKRSYRYMA